jgi:tRNA(Ile)-lysidine synthase
MGGALDAVVATGRNVVRDALADLESGARIVVGVSGGADSLALAAVTSFVADRASYELTAVVVDHGLQDGSDQVASRAVEQLATLGVDGRVVRVEVGRDGGPEAAARTARRAALADVSAARAHPRRPGRDRAAGSRPRLGAPVDLRHGAARRSVAPAVPHDAAIRHRTDRRVHDVEWWTDPHNSDPAYRRSRVRSELMPLLEDVLGGGVAEALARTADQVRTDTTHLDHLASRVDDVLDVHALADLPPALRSRVLRRAALAAGADAAALTSVHLAELDRLVTDWRGQRRVELPGRICASRTGSSLSFADTPVGG